MFTAAKRDFLVTFDELVLRPRGLSYRTQFPGPGGANAVEAALKLVRKFTGRTGCRLLRRRLPRRHAGRALYDGAPLLSRGGGRPAGPLVYLLFNTFHPDGSADLSAFDRLLGGNGNGAEPPAGVIVEAVQGEGGVRAASAKWLAALADRCRSSDIPLILDEVQMGCGRTGPFFAFEESGIKPDIVCLAKSISGYGLPLSLTLIREDLDVWEPGEHNGTFLGASASLVTGAAALRGYWAGIISSSGGRSLSGIEWRPSCGRSPPRPLRGQSSRGAGGWRADWRSSPASWPLGLSAAAFERGVLVETSGLHDEVVKLLPALHRRRRASGSRPGAGRRRGDGRLHDPRPVSRILAAEWIDQSGNPESSGCSGGRPAGRRPHTP